MSSGLRAGVSLADISPGPGIELAGYPHHPRHNTGVHDPLYASCLCLDDGATGLAIVTLDLLMYSKREVRTVRAEVERRTGIPAGNVMIATSHTHSAPWTSGRLDLEAIERGMEPDPGYLAKLRAAIPTLVETAWNGRFAASLGVGRGFCGRERGVGGNRRDPREIADPEVWVVGVKDGDGRLRACLVKYALHPTFLHSDNLLVSADYPGCIRASLAGTRPGTVFLFAQGTAGNQSPRHFRSGKTYDEAVRVGRAIGAEADRVLAEMAFRSDIAIGCRSTEVDLDLRALPPRVEAERAAAEARMAWERVKASGAAEREAWNAELIFLGAEDTLGYVLAKERGARIALLEDELPAEVQVLEIGGARIVALPGEVFVEFGVTIQYRSPFDATFVVTLANGVLPGYACTARAVAQGGYEAGTSLLTPRAGEQLVDAAVRLLRATR